jgi:hypothetical protein
MRAVKAFAARNAKALVAAGTLFAILWARKHFGLSYEDMGFNADFIKTLGAIASGSFLVWLVPNKK